MAQRKKAVDEEPAEQDAPVEEEAPPEGSTVDPEPMGAVSPSTDPQRLPEIDPGAVPADVAPSSEKRVRILSNQASASAGGAHYSLSAGAIMVLPGAVADELIVQRLAEEV